MKVDSAGWLGRVMRIPSPNCDDRPANCSADLILIHAISLPPDRFGGPSISALFTNALDPALHPYFEKTVALKVSSHALIRRDGRIVQYVSFLRRAWHAGVSSWEGRERCNDFSIGIELEGSDQQAFSAEQYAALKTLIMCLRAAYGGLALAGHCDVAPGRKTDPGPCFEWMRLA